MDGRDVTSPAVDESGRVPIIEPKQHHHVQLSSATVRVSGLEKRSRDEFDTLT